ncbi:3-hydroxybutyrate dehydrogenase [Glaciecola sp. 2405UD65-10]|uniref:3-hydroxybutyrate dehydrogenase n=1 Tax=Glaciecola sp. 2405UD65-10 TaxID=3397244 RepID=UPI003B5C0854
MNVHEHHLGSKTVLITGGASGIGYGIGEYLGKQGHCIVVADINIEAAKQAANNFTSMGINSHAILLNVTDTAAINTLPASLGDLHIDVLINNAGIQHVSKIEDFPADKFRLLIDVMLTGPALLTKALLPRMRANNYGRIINVGSIHSVIASPYKSAYVAAKHGLVGFAKTIALETGDANITINNLCPAYVKTPLVEKQIGAQAQENDMTEEEVVEKIFLQPMPKKAFIEVEELAASAAFLMADTAKNITAQNIVLDGGWTAR